MYVPFSRNKECGICAVVETEPISLMQESLNHFLLNAGDQLEPCIPLLNVLLLLLLLTLVAVVDNHFIDDHMSECQPVLFIEVHSLTKMHTTNTLA